MADEISNSESQRITIDWDAEPMQKREYYSGIPDSSIAENLKSVSKKLPSPDQDIQARQAITLIAKATGRDHFQAAPILRSCEFAGIIPRRIEMVNNREVALYDRSAIVAAIILAGTDDFEPVRADTKDFDSKGFFDMDKTAKVRLKQLGDHRLRQLMLRRFINGKEVYIEPEGSMDEKPLFSFEPISDTPENRLSGRWRLTEEQNRSLITMQLDHTARKVGDPKIPLNLLTMLRKWNEVTASKLIREYEKRPKDQNIRFDHDFDYPSYKALQFIVFSEHKLPIQQFPLVEERQLTSGQLVNYVTYLQRKLKQESVENPGGGNPSLEDLYLKTMQQAEQ